MKKQIFMAGALLAGCLSLLAQGGTHYVSPNGSHISPFTNWATASTNIQLVIDICTNNEEIVIGDGTYTITNQIEVSKSLLIRSQNGPEYTVIQRQAAGTNLPHHRIIFCSGMSYIDFVGLAISNGYVSGTERGGGIRAEAVVTVSNCWIVDNHSDRGGGGLFAVRETWNSKISYNSTTNVGGGVYGGRNYNCIIGHNEARYGGGVYTDFGALGAFYNCQIISNTASMDGGGGYQTSFDNCLVAYNRADLSGGGCNYGSMSNCTVVYNYAQYDGGGTYNCNIRNCIVYYNVADSILSYDVGIGAGSTDYCCYSIPMAPPWYLHSTTNPPLFVDASNGDFRLLSNSPCINTGKNAYSTSAYDLAGNARTNGATVDMGAYEYYPVSFDFYTITVTAGSHGSVTPSGAVQVGAGSNQTFVISADEFYHVDDVLTNGSSAGAVTSLVWQSVSANGSLTASFAENLTSNNTPEVWLDEYYPGETNFGELAVSDTDGDGIPAWQECIAGTVPTNSASKFVMTGIVSSDGVISWSSVTGKTYSIEYTDNLRDAFQPLSGATNLVSSDTAMSYTNVNTSALRVYRVVVER